MSKKLVWMASVVIPVGLAGCSQAPAPVVDGYTQTPRVANAAPLSNLMAVREAKASAPVTVPAAQVASAQMVPSVTEENLASIEPAAGDVAGQVAAVKPVQERIRASRQNEIVAETERVVREVTLPKPSLIGDIKNGPAQVDGTVAYTVQPGDTVYRIARQFQTTPQAVMSANAMTGVADIEVGQSLMIPAKGGAVAEVAHPVVDPVASVEAKAEAKLAAIEPAAGDDISQEHRAGEVTTGQDGVTYVSHKVVAGETVFRISRQYDASVIDIMSVNDLQTPQQLQTGMIIKVPSGTKSKAVPVAAASGDEGKDIAANADEGIEMASKKPDVDLAKAKKLRGSIDPVAAHANGMAWPVQGTVIRRFGEQGNGVTHTGINIKVAENTPVVATDKGTVIYAGTGLRTYGQLVLLRHGNGIVSAYAHNNDILVKKGETVRKGQVIALSGSTGNVDQPQLHFELRRAAQAVDPMRMLAAR